ncbi:HI0074 family nucleotidyltransferase substrate-binding subunit [Flavobacterium sp.]|uniref:HI0074 family nucleotidyltransferase substrate-binding subunit n=1 Tax=Flavobacterium sp. TaxID=239 RepID=UPI001B50FFDF|nr:HI0074 family nucleotidyltransferase substrate-binding subunit [Flavobacterium sp.]MBP6128524.1 nucleotidyltransferase substrate binding protein [Flavobacterium sp.]
MENQDIRWKQRFEHFIGGLRQLKNANELQKERKFTELELQGAVQAFEITQELSWKVMKDFLESQGKTDLFGSKTVVREALNVGLIANGEEWLRTIESRNKTSHIYDEKEILLILEIVFNQYLLLFVDFETKMKTFL